MMTRTALRPFFPGLLALGAVALGVASAAGEGRPPARSDENRIAFQTAALVATR